MVQSAAHHRCSIRLKGYDYSQGGAYFVTMVAYRRECLFGVIDEEGMRLNTAGRIVRAAWLDLPQHYPHVEPGVFVIMPNHVHGILILHDATPVAPRRGGSVVASMDTMPASVIPGEISSAGGDETRPYKSPNRHPLSEIVRAFKSFSARRINALRHVQGIPVWQRNYYEHIIRDDAEWKRIHLYIESNIRNWANDAKNFAR